jgi:hypothetical protein
MKSQNFSPNRTTILENLTILDQPSMSANQYRWQLFLRVTLHPPSLVGAGKGKERRN